jgi:hypothetical protein
MYIVLQPIEIISKIIKQGVLFLLIVLAFSIHSMLLVENSGFFMIS